MLSLCVLPPLARQMDSGYHTQTCGSNIMDTVGAESYCKESDAQALEVETKPQVFNTKVWKKQKGYNVLVGYKCSLNVTFLLFSPPFCLKFLLTIVFIPRSSGHLKAGGGF